MPKTLKVREIDLRTGEVGLRSIPISSLTVTGENRHDLLENRNVPNQHVIEAITNLRNELDVRVLGAPQGELSHIPLWISSDKIVNSIIRQVSGNIGIDTDSPAYKLDVNGLGRLAGILLGFLPDGPYMTEESGDLNLSNPSYRTNVGARVLHLEGLEEIALTSWDKSIILELTDRNTANSFSLTFAILPDGFYFIYNGNTIAVLDTSGKLWLKDTAIGPLSAYSSEFLDAYLAEQANEQET